ncbi:ATP-binding protein [Pedobacter sp. JCM 36344]|uniref:ATP-binding protein n=1 Tax=Pedobacter sp. JCM 36344 TaxID=3374280 RepID=UPI00397DFD83
MIYVINDDSGTVTIMSRLKKNYEFEKRFISSNLSKKEQLQNSAVHEGEQRMDYVWTDLFNLRGLLKAGILADNELIFQNSRKSNIIAVVAILLLIAAGGVFIVAEDKSRKDDLALQAEEKANREKELLMAFLLDNTTTSMYIANKYGAILYANNAFKSFVALEADQIIGKQFLQLQTTKKLHFNNPSLRNNPDPEYKETEETVTIDGKEHYYFTRKYPIKNSDGDVFACANISRDITERIFHENGLKKSREEAEHARLTQELFMANISHEIRTPMNGIMGMTDLLNGTDLNLEQRDYLKIIQQSSLNMMVLINDILDFSKIEAGMMELEHIPFKINDIVDQAFDAIRAKSIQKNLKLSRQIDHKVPLFVIGDPLRLYQILVNILSNAVKFTEHGSVGISITACSFSSPFLKVIFKITDSGIGIPEDRIGYIFQSFAQTSIDISRKFGGTGLGLAIVKQLVEMHDGSITVESRLGAGSCFSIELPFLSSTAGTWEVTDCEKFALLKDRRVLIVEDNLINQKVIVKTLDNVGVISTVCDNGFTALELLTTKEFDLIIMDIQMPEIDGRETTIRIRKQLNLFTPIIAMTASVSAEEREKCKLAGMNDYISKPFIKEDLFEKLLLHI